MRSERPSRSDLKWRELPAAYHILSGIIPSKLHTETYPKPNLSSLTKLETTSLSVSAWIFTRFENTSPSVNLRSSLRPISNIQLNALLHLHL